MKKISTGLTLSIITASILLANINIPNGTFATSLQTRTNNSSIQANGNYMFTIINPNNQKCIQNTISINKNSYNAKIYCNNGVNAKPSGHKGTSVDNIEYDFDFPDINFPELKIFNENFSLNSVFGNVNKNISNENLNFIKITNWSAFTSTINGNFKQVKNIQFTTNTVINSVGENSDFVSEEIGSKNQWNKNITINFSDYNNIYIKKITLKSNYNLNLKAKDKIVLGKVNLGSGKGYLKAPEIYIQNLNTTQNLGKNTNTIQADKVYIDTITLGEFSNLIFKPYTEGMPVKVYIKNIKTSSSSSVKLSTGEYHIQNITFPGQSAKVPSFVNLDKNQKSQIFVNHSITFNNNPVINMEHVYDNLQKEPLPARNMIWFVNGDIKIENGGNKINALMYAEGNIFIGSGAKLRGALSGKNFIHISSNNKSIIYYGGGEELDTNNIKKSLQKNEQLINNYSLIQTSITTKITGEHYLIPINIPNYSGIVFVVVINGNNQCNMNAKEYTDFIPVIINNGIGYFPLNIDIPIRDAKLLITFPNTNNFQVQNCINQSFRKHHHVSFNGQVKVLKTQFKAVSNISLEISKEINKCLIKANHKHGFHFKFTFHNTTNLTDKQINGNNNTPTENNEIETTGKINKNHFQFGFKFTHHNGNTTDNLLNNSQSVVSNTTFLCSDNFAIRPAKFIIAPIKDKIKAGKDFVIEVKAVDVNGNITPLNNYYSIGNNAIDNAHLEYNDTNNKAILGVLNYNSTIFSNGIAKIKASYNEVGQLNLKIQEKLNREFAKVDKKDTDVVQRLIPSNSQIINFIPYGFNISYTNKPLNKKANISYIGTTDLKTMNNIEMSINAINKQGEIVKNYTKDLYAKNGKIAFNVSTSIPIFTKVLINYENNVMSAPANNQKSWNIELNNISKDSFKEGVANLNIGYSFAKDYENPMPPFTTEVSNIKFSDIDNTSTINSTQTNSSVSKIKNIYERVKINNITSVKDNADIVVTYQYWNGSNWITNINHNANNGKINLVKTQLANPNFEITRKQEPINGKEIINVKIKNEIALPYSKEIHIAIPSYEWYHPLAQNYLDPSTNNTDCTTHPCTSIQFIGKSQTWTGIQSKKTTNTFEKKNNKY